MGMASLEDSSLCTYNLLFKITKGFHTDYIRIAIRVNIQEIKKTLVDIPVVSFSKIMIRGCYLFTCLYSGSGEKYSSQCIGVDKNREDNFLFSETFIYSLLHTRG